MIRGWLLRKRVKAWLATKLAPFHSLGLLSMLETRIGGHLIRFGVFSIILHALILLGESVLAGQEK
jgi:hypothetical protein